MCGIYGYLGAKNAAKACLEGLKLLEYRGYDSAGIAGIHQGKIHYRKEIGKLHNLEASLHSLPPEFTNAIAHTRWATHGKPSKENCHPLFDQHLKIAVVHNGIIENHFSLRQMLIKQGFQFQSQTDTEVIAQLISYYYKGDFLQAFYQALAELKGFWAIAAIHQDHPKQILATAKECPLSIGISPCQSEIYLSSDVNAFYTSDLDVFFLENNETAFLSDQGVQTFNSSASPILKKTEKLSCQGSFASKNGFEHFMLKEIFEQPYTIHQALQGRICQETGSALFEDFSLSTEDLLLTRQIFLVACGTSWHAGCIAASWLEEKARIPTRSEIASEFRYKDTPILPNTLAIAISQSGETFDTLAAVKELKAKGAKVLAICNVKNSTLTRLADACLYLQAGPEISVCSTKAFTSQLTVLALFSLYLSRLKGQMTLQEGSLFLEQLTKLPSQVELILQKAPMLRSLAQKYANYQHFFFLGRSYMYPTCLEGALKLKEISYLSAIGLPAGEMKHGSIALVDANLVVIGLCGDTQVLDKMESNLMEIKAREAPLIALAPEEAKEIQTMADDFFPMPPICRELAAIPYSVATQLFAYYVALEKGEEIDQPRNLAKSVTVE